MTWDYSGDPSSSPKDLIRFLTGDTISTRQLLQNEEINGVLTLQPIPSWAAAACADAIANNLSTRVDKAIGQTRISLSQQVKQYREMADRFRAGGPGNLPGGDGSGERSAVAFAGGMSVADNEGLREEVDTEQESFSVGQDDQPGIPLNRRR